MKKSLFLLFLASCFATAGQAFVVGSDTFGSGTIAELEPGEYYVYYTDAQGVDRFLYAAGDNNWIVTDEQKSVEITEGNVNKDNSGGVAYAKFAYHMNSSGYFMSNCASSNGSGAIKTEPLDGKNASYDRCWESQVFYENIGRYAIRLTNCDSESWGANCFANTTGSQVFSSQPNLENALYIWNVVKVDAYGASVDIDALIDELKMQANAFIVANPTIQCNVLTVLQEQISNPTDVETLRNAFLDFMQYCRYSNYLQKLISQMIGIEAINEATATAMNVLYNALSTTEDLKLAYEQYLQEIEATTLFNKDGDILWAYDESTNALTLWGTGVGNMKNYYSFKIPWETYAAQVQTIIVRDGVLNIGYNAFYNCSRLSSITIPESVTSIGDNAFHYCSSLTSINIPSGVTSIGSLTFYYCSSLTSITIPEGVTNIGNEAFHGCSSLTSITFPECVTTIGDRAFEGCSSLASITIPEGVTSIGYNAFYGCSSLASIFVDDGNVIYDSRSKCNAIIETTSNTLIVGCKSTSIPSNVTSIGNYAFYNCSSLTFITIPESVTNIGSNAFENCSSLASITIPASVTSIGSHAFRSCISLASIIVDDGNAIYESRNNCNAIIETASGTLIVGCESTLIPTNVTSIGDYAFYSCRGLTSIILPDGVTSIGDYAFYSCSSLTSIILPDGLVSIGDDAFRSCGHLTSITIPKSVTSIGTGAFLLCSSLVSIALPESVTTIGSSAFKYCSRLTSIYACGAQPAYIYNEGNTFERAVYENATLYVPIGCLAAYREAAGWKEFVHITEMETMVESLEMDFRELQPAYDLSGSRIDNPDIFHGIYIQGGKAYYR